MKAFRNNEIQYCTTNNIIVKVFELNLVLIVGYFNISIYPVSTVKNRDFFYLSYVFI